MKKGKSPRRTTRKTRRTSHLKRNIILVVICIACLLAFISLLPSNAAIKADYHILRDRGIPVSIFQTGLDIKNPIGNLGVLISYLLIKLLGSTLALFLCAFVAAYCFFTLFRVDKTGYRIRSYLLVIDFFLLQTIIAGLSNTRLSLIPQLFWKLLVQLIKPLGTMIVLWSGMIFIAVMLVGVERLRQWFLIIWEDYQRWQEQRERQRHIRQERPPRISTDQEPVINPELVAPVIKDHNQNAITKDKDSPSKDRSHDHQPPKPRPDQVPTPTDEDDEEPRIYQIPSISDFLESPTKLSKQDMEKIENQILQTSKILKDKLGEFGIEATVKNVNIGPIITQYELEPAPGVKVSRFTSLADDLALAIKAKSIRVQAPIPGRGLIGIEIPNLTRDMIYLRDILLSEDIRQTDSKLAFGLGKDIAGKPVITDLAKMPHLLIAGATGSGKSVCINTIIMSLLLRTKPDDLRLVLIDPKRVELAGYNELPHLIGSVVTDPDAALETMYWAVKEMERRYVLFQEVRARDIAGYNERIKETGEGDRLPYIIVIVDEFADLIMTSGKDIELPITRLAQMARAVGIHLILATQRPSIKVITGIIKANFPARIAFQVSSRVDSRVIMDMNGAERLLGQGDMLFLPPGKAVPERIHGAYVSDHEIARVCDFLRLQPKPKQEVIISIQDTEQLGFFDYDDELFPEAARVVVRANMASVSMLQRHFKIGYARAGRLIDMLEQAHIIGPHLGSKSRDVLATRSELVKLGLTDEED
ncbi:MAG: cell division protein FtsK [Candidatus Cloacimonetes bacterium]|nr:cell division protein FtsK [Candidatus Cloacimonadota bacterium]